MSDIFSQKQVLVTGGAGFIGSHLVERLVDEGAQVTVVDNLITGNRQNLANVLPVIRYINADVVAWAHQQTHKPTATSYNFIYHLASPASPRGYQENPVQTYLVNSVGTHNLVTMALKMKARLLFASTSEVYGDPLEHPQTETYFGNVNPIGPRACYDESKRFGEMVVMNAVVNDQLDGRIVRIFNTYGPRMDPADGRVFPNFINQALKQIPITVHGDGQQTRSFCYVDDLVEYLVRAMSMATAKGEVINLGNPEEHTMLAMAETIKTMTQSSSIIIFDDRLEDDPTKRKPNISKARKILRYKPQISLTEGLNQTINFFRQKL